MGDILKIGCDQGFCYGRDVVGEGAYRGGTAKARDGYAADSLVQLAQRDGMSSIIIEDKLHIQHLFQVNNLHMDKVWAGHEVRFDNIEGVVRYTDSGRGETVQTKG